MVLTDIQRKLQWYYDLCNLRDLAYAEEVYFDIEDEKNIAMLESQLEGYLLDDPQEIADLMSINPDRMIAIGPGYR